MSGLCVSWTSCANTSSDGVQWMRAVRQHGYSQRASAALERNTKGWYSDRYLLVSTGTLANDIRPRGRTRSFIRNNRRACLGQVPAGCGVGQRGLSSDAPTGQPLSPRSPVVPAVQGTVTGWKGPGWRLGLRTAGAAKLQPRPKPAPTRREVQIGRKVTQTTLTHYLPDRYGEVARNCRPRPVLQQLWSRGGLRLREAWVTTHCDRIQVVSGSVRPAKPPRLPKAVPDRRELRGGSRC